MTAWKGTPGPWHRGEGQQALFVYGPDGYAVADGTTYHGRHPAAQVSADLDGIAAVPQLVDELVEARSLLVTAQDFLRLRANDGHQASRELWDEIEARVDTINAALKEAGVKLP